MGGIAAYVFLKALSQTGMLAKFQESLGAKVYDRNRRNKEGNNSTAGYAGNAGNSKAYEKKRFADSLHYESHIDS